MSISIQGAVPSGTTLTDNPVLVAGADSGAVVRTLLTDGSGRVEVVGAAAVGTTPAGNPMNTGAIAGDTGNMVSLLASTAATPNLRASLYTGANPINSAVAVDAQATNTFPLNVRSINQLYNGTTLDFARNAVDATLLVSAIRTATVSGADITTYNLTAINVILNVTAGSGTLFVTIVGKDPASATYYPLLTSAPVTTNSMNVYRVGMGLNPLAGLVANDRLPRVIAIIITHGNANLVTYSVGYTLMP